MSCQPRFRRLIDAHFAGRIRRDAEEAMRRHLPDCAACRAYYGQHLVLAEADPAAPTAELRLARGLGLRPRRANRLVWGGGLAAATAAAAVFLAWSPPEDDFAARGPGEVTPRLRIFELGPENASTLVDTRIAIHAELAFTYRNPEGRDRLLLFAVDQGGHVFWYEPSWLDSDENPAAVEAHTGRGFHEIEKATRHELSPGQLWVYFVLLDVPIRAREVEALVADLARPGEPLPLPDATQEVRQLEVSP